MRTRVLVVDDEPAVGEIVQAVLESVGMEADYLSDTRKAALRLTTEKLDAIFLDVHMPQPDGLALARLIRADGFSRETPIVMITGEENPAILKAGFEAGANFFLFKPFNRLGLLRVVRVSQALDRGQKRGFQRAVVCVPVRIESKERTLEGITFDLSLSGMLVEAPGIFAPGTAVQVTVHLPQGRPPMQLSGRVVRVLGNQRMGIEFLNLVTAEGKVLQGFLLPLILSQIGAELPVSPRA